MTDEARAAQAEARQRAERQAGRLREKARTESRAARRHRRRAKYLFEQADAILRAHAAYGIGVRVELGTPPSPQGGPSDTPPDQDRAGS